MDFISQTYSDFYVLNELNLGKHRAFGLIQNIDKSFLRYIDGTLIIVNKHHIEDKNVNNSRFPDDPEIKKYVAPSNISNCEEHIKYILDKTIKRKSTSVKRIIDEIMNKKYGDTIIKTSEYDYKKDDVPFKLSLYHNFKWFDKSKNSYRLFRLESALAVYGTFLTFDRYPLTLIDEWDIKTNNNSYQKRIISSVNSCIAQFRQKNNYDLFDTENGKLNKDFLIKHNNYILYINGYSTWVKEVNSAKDYIYNNEFNLSTNNGKDLKDLYKDLELDNGEYYRVPDIQTMCIPEVRSLILGVINGIHILGW